VLDGGRDLLERLHLSGSIDKVCTSATPNWPFTGWLTSLVLSENAAFATAVSMMPFFGTVPRSMSWSFSLRSAAIAPNAVPLVMRSRAAFASSSFGNTI
jgi:hypothetical protein